MPINMAGIKKKWLKSLRVMSNVKVLHAKRPAGWPNTTHCMDLHDTHMGKKISFCHPCHCDGEFLSTRQIDKCGQTDGQAYSMIDI